MKRRECSKFSMCLLLIVFLILGGCSSNGSSTSTGESKSSSSVESEEVSSSVPEKSSIEIVFSNGKNLLKYNTGANDNNVVFLSEIKNTSNVQLSLDDISIEVNDPKGKLVGVVDYIYARPTVIDPGESAYICEELISGLHASLGKDITKEQCATAKCIINYRESSGIIPVDGEFKELDIFSTDDGCVAANGRAVSYQENTIDEAYVIIPVKDQSNNLQTVLVDMLPQSLTPNTPVAFTTQDFESVPDIDLDSINIDGAIICGPRKMFGY